MAARTPKSGDVLGGKYRVERVIGSGGMGVVVAAKHVDLGQRVAVKLMLEEAMSDPAHAERFAREARAAVQLKSIHTARVLDVGKTKGGEPFMVMEYLEGHDLDEVVKRGPLPPHIAVDYILQACEAFAEAHAIHMVHRDIKLKNLFLTSTVDGRALVKVLDFGLAKKVGVSGGDVSLTSTSAVFGSPQYMSPEQMRSAKDVDARSDIWSIGVCLYELLTGHVPFDASGVAEICAMVLKDPVPPPSRWTQGIPPDLEAIILRCLEKDPQMRFQTVADLAFALEPYSGVEGSANRILHVMESARHNSLTGPLPEIVASPENARTLAAWGSAAQLQSKRTSMIALAAAGVFAILAVAVIAFVVGRTKNAATAELPVQATSAPLAAEPIPTAATTETAPAPATPPTTIGAGTGPGSSLAATDPAPTVTAPTVTAPSVTAPRPTSKAGSRPPSTPRTTATATAPAKTAPPATTRPPAGSYM